MSKASRLEKKISISGFDSWRPKDYLHDYYSHVEQDERFTIKFLVDEFKKIKRFPVALEFGIGPTLHHAIPLAPYVSEIHVADYLDSNLDEVRSWVRSEPGSHDWHPFTKITLEYEGVTNPGVNKVVEREEDTKTKITKFYHGDASVPFERSNFKSKYDMVLSCYCADSATTSKIVWDEYMTNIVSLLKPGGFFVTSALRKCRYYKVGDRFFPCAYVSELDFEELFQKLDFNSETVNIMIKEVPEHASIGYESIVLASGFKND